MCQSHVQPCSSAAMGMPSTTDISRRTYSASPSASGAMEKPQFPPMIVVTPCNGEGLAAASHMIWAS